MKCYTQQQIADEVGMPQRTVSAKTDEIIKIIEDLAKKTDLKSKSSVSERIEKIKNILKESSENAELQIPNDYAFLSEKIDVCSDFSPLLYNIWNQQSYLNLHLKCYTQQQIADEVGIARTNVLTKLEEIDVFLKEMSENPELKIPIKFEFLVDFKENCQDFQPLLHRKCSIHFFQIQHQVNINVSCQYSINSFVVIILSPEY